MKNLYLVTIINEIKMYVVAENTQKAIEMAESQMLNWNFSKISSKPIKIELLGSQEIQKSNSFKNKILNLILG